MKKIGAWFRRWGAWLSGALLFLLGAGWLWNSYRRRLGAAKDAAKVAEARRRLDELKATRETLSLVIGEKDARIEEIDTQLAESRRKVADLHEHGADIPDEDLEDLFARLGY